MLIRGINFPDELVRASRNGRLVIFVGAGVSKPPPSNYPDFAELAEEVATGQSLKRGELDIDRFLGRLEDHGVQVHHIVQARLSVRIPSRLRSILPC